MSKKFDSSGTSYSLNKVNKKNPIVFVHGVGLTKDMWDPQINLILWILATHLVKLMKKHQ